MQKIESLRGANLDMKNECMAWPCFLSGTLTPSHQPLRSPSMSPQVDGRHSGPMRGEKSGEEAIREILFPTVKSGSVNSADGSKQRNWFVWTVSPTRHGSTSDLVCQITVSESRLAQESPSTASVKMELEAEISCSPGYRKEKKDLASSMFAKLMHFFRFTCLTAAYLCSIPTAKEAH